MSTDIERTTWADWREVEDDAAEAAEIATRAIEGAKYTGTAEPDAPATSSGPDTECRGCGAQVTERFARVFGDAEERLYACINCTDRTQLRDGAGAGREPTGHYDYRVGGRG